MSQMVTHSLWQFLYYTHAHTHTHTQFTTFKPTGENVKTYHEATGNTIA